MIIVVLSSVDFLKDSTYKNSPKIINVVIGNSISLWIWKQIWDKASI